MNVLLIAYTSRMYADALERVLAEEPGLDVLTTDVDGLSLTAGPYPADIVLVAAGSQLSGIAPAIAAVKGYLPHAPIVLLLPELSSDLIRYALTAGVAGFLTEDESLWDLLQALHQARRGKMVFPAAAGFLHTAGKEPGPGADLRLTPRELDVLAQVATGREDQEAAQLLYISLLTLRTHVRNILRKLGVHSRMAAVVKAAEIGLIALPGRR